MLTNVVTDVCGIHAQLMSAAELSIWARVENVSPELVRDELWKHRGLVKTWAMRGTLHLIAANDMPMYVAALKTRHGYRSNAWLKFYKLTLPDVEAVIDGVWDALDRRNLTRAQLAEVLGKRLGSRIQRELSSGWGSVLKPAAYRGNLCFGPTKGQNITFVRPDQWLGRWREVDSEEALRELLRRYLKAYGPATHEDFARWFGMLQGRARAVLKSVIGELADVVVEGRHCWLLSEDLKRIETLRPAQPVRLLPNFDSYVLGYYPREKLCPRGFQSRIFRPQAWVSPVVLVNGAAAGIWKQIRKTDVVTVDVESFLRLGPELKRGIEREVKRLGEFSGVHARLAFSKRI